MNIVGNVAMVLRQKGTEVFGVSPQATVLEALQLMAEKNIGAVLVLEGWKVVGVFSERDWARHVAQSALQPADTCVSQMVAGEVVCVSPSDEIVDCMRLMTRRRVRHLPVVEDGHVVGLVSIGDVVNWVILAQDSTIEQLEYYIAGVYPG
jgi:CBS domain-containing protein